MEIKALTMKIIAFRDKRNWGKFHKMKDLLLGLSIESSELAELFQWKTEEEMSSVPKHRIEEEVADLFIFLVYICDFHGIKLDHAVTRKIQQNEEKYPVDKSYNSNKKYNELE